MVSLSLRVWLDVIAAAGEPRKFWKIKDLTKKEFYFSPTLTERSKFSFMTLEQRRCPPPCLLLEENNYFKHSLLALFSPEDCLGFNITRDKLKFIALLRSEHAFVYQYFRVACAFARSTHSVAKATVNILVKRLISTSWFVSAHRHPGASGAPRAQIIRVQQSARTSCAATLNLKEHLSAKHLKTNPPRIEDFWRLFRVNHAGRKQIFQPFPQTEVSGCSCAGWESETNSPRKSHPGR